MYLNMVSFVGFNLRGSFVFICISYIPGRGALPDIYAWLPRGMQHPRTSADILGKARVPAI